MPLRHRVFGGSCPGFGPPSHDFKPSELDFLTIKALIQFLLGPLALRYLTLYPLVLPIMSVAIVLHRDSWFKLQETDDHIELMT
ncbi:hypothetical protein EUGRSUZ_H04685 [Eucalyptus grandis]|uniref:Uncharacterized protein n=2 Tax=Eucalyptus grandis TaxID=71139 RepID=A0A059B807_EUCGR|nr:hypothetical protein EUGRSUZ_H04685 [Eucalyptus grandis]